MAFASVPTASMFRVNAVERDDGGLAEHDALAAGEDAGVGGAEIDGQVIREDRERAEQQSLQSETAESGAGSDTRSA